MALVVAEDKTLCDQCNYCFEKSLDLEYFKRSYRYYSAENFEGDYLIVYMQPNLEMMLNDFDLTKRSYGYHRFLSLLQGSYIHFPILRGISNENDKGPTKKQSRICKDYLISYIEKAKFKQVIVLGIDACSLFGIDLNKVQRVRVGGKIVTVLGLKSPSSIYYHSGTMLKDQTIGDDYYTTYLTVLKDLSHEIKSECTEEEQQ